MSVYPKGFSRIRTLGVISATTFGLLLGACSSPATSYNMIVDQSDVVAAHPDTPYKHALAIAHVDGGEETYKLWTSEVDAVNFRKALESSLGLSRLLADPVDDARFDLYVNIAEVDQPAWGIDYTVTSRIEYRVIEKGTSRVWFSDALLGRHTYEFNPGCLLVPGIIQPFVGPCYSTRRLRWANEGSVRENIKLFIEKLLERPPPPDLRASNIFPTK